MGNMNWNRRTALGAVASVAFVACVVIANLLTANYGMVAVGFGLVATAGTYAAGATFVLRDAVDDLLGRRAVLFLVLAGAALAGMGGAGRIALASVLAFAAGELFDFAVYRKLRSRGYVKAAVASNIVGSLVDTVLFLAVAGFPIWASVPGQVVGKLWITLAVVLAVVGARAVLRQSVRA